MQNKGVIRLFAIIFALACIYQLSFTYVSRSVEGNADDYAQGDLQKRQAYLDSMNNEIVYGLLGYTYADVKEKEINLGLDLRGGMNVILEVQVADILKELANNTKDPVFNKALTRAKEQQIDSQEDFLSTFFSAFEEVKAQGNSSIALSDPKIFGTKEMNDKLGFNASDEKVQAEIVAQVEAAVANVYTVLRARIDQFGVVQPNIQRLENGGRILIELPGVKDPDRVKKLLQSTAELGFWNLHDGYELLNFLGEANNKLRTIVDRSKSAINNDSTEAAPQSDILNIQSIDDSDSTDIAANEESDSTDTALNDSTDTFNPLFEVISPNYNFQTGQPGQGPIVGFVLVKDTAKVNKYLRNPKIRALLPGDLRNTKFMWTAKADEGDVLYLLAAKTDRQQKPVLTGDVVTDARQDFDQGNQPVVSMTMNAQGAAKWQRITRDASSQDPKKSVAVVLDNYVYSYPVVNGEIPTGNTQIAGSFTINEAQDLANILKAGALPAPAKIIQAEVVGPSLGKEAIQAGLWSFVVALFLVMLYMIFYYSGAGIASDIALVVNMFFIFGVLASLGAVLTLPGIAGIVLTIGMAVDANVLIYERIREELGHGKGLSLAIKDGYSNAYSSIIDANVTTFLTGVILYLFGTGPIRGFATTLIIGILTSLFCAIFITRLIFESQLNKKKVVKFSTNLTKNAFRNFSIDFLGKRKISYGISTLIIVLGIISLLTKGLNYSVDFVGGRSYQVRFDQSVSSADIQSALGDVFIDADGNKVFPEVKTIGSDNQVIITTKYRVSETGTEVEEDIKAKLFEGVQAFYAEVPTSEVFFTEASETDELGVLAERQVGPTIADDIKKSAVWAILFSLIVIFLYILIRFSRWQFSLGAVAAAFHDVMIVLSLFSIFNGILPFSLEIDQAFIAAILTVIGYSLNDTVVVFDRIREYVATHAKKKEMTVVVNDALNSTLSRTVNTSLTTFFVLLVIFIFGGDSIRGFMFALLIGVVVGTYSSLFIATPLMLDTSKRESKKKG